MKETITHISLWGVIKNSSYVAAFVAGFEWLNITPETVAILAILVVVDIITGVLKTAAIKGWRQVFSSEFERGITAKSIIVLAPIVVALAGKGVGMDFSAFAQGAITMLVFGEAYSIMGNIYSIRTGTVTKEFDAVAFAIANVKKALKRFIVDDAEEEKK